LDFLTGNRGIQPCFRRGRFEREIYLALSGKLVAILASDKKGVAGSVETLLALAETDVDSFNALYQTAIEANPSLAEKTGQ
jgi:hypothetical protein